MDLRGGNGRNMGTPPGRYRAWRGGRLGRRRCARRPERLLPRLCRRRGARGAGLLAATVDDKVVTDRPADASGAQNDVGFRDVLAQARTTHGLFVPLAFGFVDRLTAGFFALVGVYYFQDPETFGLSAGAAGATLALFFVPFAVLQARSARFRTEWGASSPSCSGRSRTGSSLSASVWRRSTRRRRRTHGACRCLRRADGAGDDGARHGSGRARGPAARRWDCSTCSARSGSSPASSSAGAPPICSATRPRSSRSAGSNSPSRWRCSRP